MPNVKKRLSPWNSQLKKLPEWVKIRALSRACGFKTDYLGGLVQGRSGLSSAEAKKVIRELKKLTKIIEYQQGELL